MWLCYLIKYNLSIISLLSETIDNENTYYISMNQFKQLNLAKRATVSGEDTKILMKSNDSNYIVGIIWLSYHNVLDFTNFNFQVFTP